MLGLRMLQKANFPTFMGNSLVMDTINLTVPSKDRWVIGEPGLAPDSIAARNSATIRDNRQQIDKTT